MGRPNVLVQFKLESYYLKHLLIIQKVPGSILRQNNDCPN
jgi:hypothetical protein